MATLIPQYLPKNTSPYVPPPIRVPNAMSDHGMMSVVDSKLMRSGTLIVLVFCFLWGIVEGLGVW